MKIGGKFSLETFNKIPEVSTENGKKLDVSD